MTCVPRRSNPRCSQLPGKTPRCASNISLASTVARMQHVQVLFIFSILTSSNAFLGVPYRAHDSALHMKRPWLDQLASAIFQLEQTRVESSSVKDEQGRIGEPMEWSEKNSLANQFSEAVASNDLGYRFKQWVADLVAGEFDENQVALVIDDFVANNKVAMFSFTTCPFCRRAKDFLDEKGVMYSVMELDQRNDGNQIRAILGTRVRRTSMPAIFIGGEFIGGCNDGPGLLPLAASGELDKMLSKI